MLVPEFCPSYLGSFWCGSVNCILRVSNCYKMIDQVSAMFCVQSWCMMKWWLLFLRQMWTNDRCCFLVTQLPFHCVLDYYAPKMYINSIEAIRVWMASHSMGAVTLLAPLRFNALHVVSGLMWKKISQKPLDLVWFWRMAAYWCHVF
jgi:hypothetical protein